MSRSRSAEATIKGFNYQFDATIKMLIEAKGNEEVTIEGVEDIDIKNSSLQIESVQCKYYAGTDLLPSTFRDIVKPMLEHYVKNKSEHLSYTLYGYFKTISDFHLNNVSLFKSNILSYSKLECDKTDDSSKKPTNKTNHNIATDLSLTDSDLQSFLQRFKFIKTADYETHKKEIKQKLGELLGCSESEVEHHYYPNAQSFVYEVAIKKSLSERKITATNFIEKIKSPKTTLFNQWYLEEKGNDAFCKKIRRYYFSPSNVSPYARFFVIECKTQSEILDIKNVVLEISKKWSSHRKIRVTPSERYSPYILLRGLDSGIFYSLLHQIYKEGISFVDGFPYKNSPFSLQHITQNQTTENKISLRFIEDTTQLSTLLQYITNQTKEVYDFFVTNHLQIQPDIKAIHIPFRKISDIEQMI